MRAENDPTFDDPEKLHKLLPQIAKEVEQTIERKISGQNNRIDTTNRGKEIAKVSEVQLNSLIYTKLIIFPPVNSC